MLALPVMLLLGVAFTNSSSVKAQESNTAKLGWPTSGFIGWRYKTPLVGANKYLDCGAYEHTGLDLLTNPTDVVNETGYAIYPAAPGKLVSFLYVGHNNKSVKYGLVMEHVLNGEKVYTQYIHMAKTSNDESLVNAALTEGSTYGVDTLLGYQGNLTGTNNDTTVHLHLTVTSGIGYCTHIDPTRFYKWSIGEGKSLKAGDVGGVDEGLWVNRTESFQEGRPVYQKVTHVNFAGKVFQSTRGFETDASVGQRSMYDDINFNNMNIGFSTAGETRGNITSTVLKNGTAEVRMVQAMVGKNPDYVDGLPAYNIYTRTVEPSNPQQFTAWEIQAGKTSSDTVAMVQLGNKLYQSIVGRTGGIFTRSSVDGKNWSAWSSLNGSAKGNVEMFVTGSVLNQMVTGSSGNVFHRISVDGEFDGKLFGVIANTENWTDTKGSTDRNISTAVGSFNGQVFAYQVMTARSDRAVLSRYVNGSGVWSNWQVLGPQLVAGGGVTAYFFNGQFYVSTFDMQNDVNTMVVSLTSNGSSVVPQPDVFGWSKNGKTGQSVDFHQYSGRLYQTVRGFGSVQKIFSRSIAPGAGWQAWK